MGKYKLVHRYKTGRSELYDLERDIGEKKDLSAEKPELSEQMLEMLKEWNKHVNARFPEGFELK